MPKLSLSLCAVIVMMTAVFSVCLQTLETRPALSALSESSYASPILIGTAAQAPSLVSAKLGGKPVHVLYMTQAGDTVLVRCYPGYLPVLSIQSMGSKPGLETAKEGIMTCKAPS